jgi:hypothetical protein
VKTFPFAMESSPRALISGRRLSRTCAFLLRDFRAHHHVLRCFLTLVARTYTVCRSGTSFRARGQSRVHGPLHWTRTYPAALQGGRNHVADSRAYTGLRWPGPTLVPGTHTGPWDPHWSLGRQLYRDTRLLRQRRPLPSLPGSTALSSAPSGFSPRLSATRVTPSRAPIWRAARYHDHESVTPAE